MDLQPKKGQSQKLSTLLSSINYEPVSNSSWTLHKLNQSLNTALWPVKQDPLSYDHFFHFDFIPGLNPNINAHDVMEG